MLIRTAHHGECPTLNAETNAQTYMSTERPTLNASLNAKTNARTTRTNSRNLSTGKITQLGHGRDKTLRAAYF